MSEPKKQVELPIESQLVETQISVRELERELRILRESEIHRKELADFRARLRAVSEYLNNIRGSAHYDHIITRLRAIVEGK